MRLRELRVGCFGGGWSSQSSRGPQEQSLATGGRGRHHVRQRRQLRVATRWLGVLPPGDVQVRARAGAQRAQARRVLLAGCRRWKRQARRPHRGNLLLSMMQRYAAISWTRSGCVRSQVPRPRRPVTVHQASVCANAATDRSRVERWSRRPASSGRFVSRIWLEPLPRFIRRSPRRSAGSTPSRSDPAASIRA